MQWLYILTICISTYGNLLQWLHAVTKLWLACNNYIQLLHALTAWCDWMYCLQAVTEFSCHMQWLNAATTCNHFMQSLQAIIRNGDHQLSIHKTNYAPRSKSMRTITPSLTLWPPLSEVRRLPVLQPELSQEHTLSTSGCVVMHPSIM